jgi:anti-anti-sigma regulatory factor
VLAFCGLTPTIDKTFRIMGLAQYAAIYPTEDEALRAVGGTAPTSRPQVTGPQ